MGKSLYQRHFLLTAGMILLSFALLGVSFIGISYRFVMQEKKDALTSNAAYVSQLAGRLVLAGAELEEIDLRDFNQYLTALSVVTESDMAICNPEGVVVCTSQRDSDQLSDSEDRAMLGERLSADIRRDILRGGIYMGMDYAGIFETNHFIVAEAVVVGDHQHMVTQQDQAGHTYRIPGEPTDGVEGYVVVSVETTNLTELWRTFSNLYLATAVVVLILAFVSSLVTTGHMVQPLREMTEVVRRFGMGDYDQRAKKYNQTTEVEELASSFNAMADSIASAEQRRQEFVANISHELKTPMTTIAGFVDGILDGTIPPEKQEESLRVVSAETRRLSRLVRQMLDMSQLQNRESAVVSQSQFDMVETLAQVLISLEGKIVGRGLDVDAQFPDNAVMVWGDPDSITQVCYNLLDNAIKFAAPHSVIGLSITSRDNKAYITVRNTGETIPPEELPLIFDRFHKSDRSRSLDKEGVGLGLYIVKSILNGLKENITVTSENGVTEFTFTLTRAE